MLSRRSLCRMAAVTPLASGLVSRSYAEVSLIPTFKATNSSIEIARNPLTGIGGNIASFAEVGPYGVRDTPVYFTINLSGQERKVFYYLPERLESAMPALYFSHDIGLTPQLHKDLLMRVASHGFVVIAPVHDDSPLTNTVLAGNTDQTSQQIWDNRVSDFLQLLKNVAKFQSQTNVDIGKWPLGICGIGYGALIASYLSGATLKDKGKWPYDVFSFLIITEPSQVQIPWIEPQTFWGSVTRPSLLIAGTADPQASDDVKAKLILPYKLMPQGQFKTLAWFSQPTPSTFLLKDIADTDLTPYFYLSLLTEFCTIYGYRRAQFLPDLRSDYYQRVTHQQLNVFTSTS